MKTRLFLLIPSIFIGLMATAQNSVPNGNFEDWNSAVYEIPDHYTESSNPQTFFRCNAPFNCVKTTDAYHGSYAVKLTTEGGGNDACVGYFINANADGNPSTWTGGIAYTQNPTGIRGFYKSAIPVGDSGIVIANFRLAGNSIGFYAFKLYGTHTSYTPFSFTLSPPLPSNPDTVQIGITSSDFMSGLALSGSMLQIDSLSFTGVTSQPAELNGDFESWQSETITNPADWYTNSGESNGVFQTTDAVAGNYALELKTYLGDNNGNPVARGGDAGTGYYVCPNSSNCFLAGGSPFSNQIDTLAFYYKYAPSGNDSALITVNFKNNGTNFNGIGMYLHAAATYQYVEIPFNLGQTVDTAIIQIQSSVWNDTALSFVGSDLKIDEIHFKSQPLNTGIVNYSNDNRVRVYPNPSSGKFMIQSETKTSTIEIINILGEKVYSNELNSYKSEIDLSKEGKGIYFYTLRSGAKMIGTGKLIVK